MVFVDSDNADSCKNRLKRGIFGRDESAIWTAKSEGVDLNYGYTNKLGGPLHDAVCVGYLPTVEALLRFGANPNCLMDVYPASTPLHIAAANGDSAIIRSLLRYGADPSILNGLQKTAQQIAEEKLAQYGDKDFAECISRLLVKQRFIAPRLDNTSRGR